MTLETLRNHVIVRSGGRCEWPDCRYDGAEMAHGKHRGMGGKHPAVNVPENVWWLCRFHHDLLDGRTRQGARVEWVKLLKAATR